jgi:hypothetical protein
MDFPSMLVILSSSLCFQSFEFPEPNIHLFTTLYQ